MKRLFLAALGVVSTASAKQWVVGNTPIFGQPFPPRIEVRRDEIALPQAVQAYAQQMQR